MKRIKLSQGKFALVDDADFEWLSQHKWYLLKKEPIFYTWRSTKVNGKWITVRMHRQIMGLKAGDGKEVDHRNGNGLDNRRENLRICSRSVNMQNRHKKKKGKPCKYQGVTKIKKTGRWLSYITQNYENIHVGVFGTAKEAAHAYDKKALELYGPDAKLNFPKETSP